MTDKSSLPQPGSTLSQNNQLNKPSQSGPNLSQATGSAASNNNSDLKKPQVSASIAAPDEQLLAAKATPAQATPSPTQKANVPIPQASEMPNTRSVSNAGLSQTGQGTARTTAVFAAQPQAKIGQGPVPVPTAPISGTPTPTIPTPATQTSAVSGSPAPRPTASAAPVPPVLPTKPVSNPMSNPMSNPVAAQKAAPVQAPPTQTTPRPVASAPTTPPPVAPPMPIAQAAAKMPPFRPVAPPPQVVAPRVTAPTAAKAPATPTAPVLPPPMPPTPPAQAALKRPLPAGLSNQAPGGMAPSGVAAGVSAPRVGAANSANITAGMAPPPPPPRKPAAAGQGTPAPTASTTTAAQQNQAVAPKIAKPEKFPKKMILIAIAGLLVVSILGLLFQALFGGSKTKPVSTTGSNTKQTGTTTGSNDKTQAGKTTGQTNQETTTLVYWGLWEPNEVLKSIISDFEADNPSIKIDYRVQSHVDYRERLQTAIASGNGPDLFRFHASWTPMLKSELAPMPTKVMSATEFQKTFYPVAAEQLQSGGQIVGLPLMYDGLVLYYNKEMLKTANAQPPATWSELRKLADQLTVPADKSERGSKIERGGLAIGNATNVEHFSDILALLILQNGGDLSQPNSTEVGDALKFYSNFAKTDKVWNDKLPSSTVAFARGEVAMMFAPSWRAHEIKNLNPSLEFGMAAVPQLSDQPVSWASYWAEGVNEKGKNKDLAWTFLKYLSSKEVQKKFYSSASQIRAFGEPYSRLDLASDLKSDESLTNLLNDALVAKSGAMCSFTHDNGINDNTNKYYADAIESMLLGKDLDSVLETLDQGVKEVSSQYN